ncbi:YggS family pyridoxal phosphate-dependent enzyme [Subtercola sp. PAMC28395]|uniref:YggS family pyridoxal phosphate-dependent enzyme n=1 Tax=Subtercola sp. PAMC28395 TaxID=2846775 RepID=UPI00209AB10A|nr:YggS family pyridoxal phosphate-dependent enzyme [Subtercola sp. PAMC28395]
MTTIQREGETDLAGRLAFVRAGIAEAAAANSRPLDEITLIVVTKFHPAGLVRELMDLGVTDFGESRHQEAREKVAELAGTPAAWHFIGQLQGKKAKQVAAYASVIHSLDRPSLADLLSAADVRPTAGPTDVFLQVNLTDDTGRGGVVPGGARELAEYVEALPGLRLRGVMGVAPLGEEPRFAFERLRAVSELVTQSVPRASAISAGMSHDYSEAIAEGATHLRIGSAITGIRAVAG